MRITPRILSLAIVAAFALLLPPSRCQAQTASQESLLALVPSDVGLCVVVNDLRGHAQKWERSPWVQSLRQTSLVKAILDMPEARQIAGLEGELKKHLGIDWPTLRDDILGDSVVLAYTPGTPAHPEQEQGMIALRAAKPRLLADLVDRFNRLQKDRGDLDVQGVKHLGVTYYRRTVGKNTYFYYLDGPLLIVAGSEPMLQAAIARDLGKAKDASPWPARFARAGAGKSLVTLGVNPRAFDLFPAPAKDGKSTGFAGLWRALDGVFVTLKADTDIELRLSLQGRASDMPAWAQHLFKETPPPSVLWQRFPEPSILTIAARTDFANLVDQMLATLPPDQRGKLTLGMQTAFNFFLGLDLFRDVLPNIGPDWGICVLPAKEGAAGPQVIAALAVKPGSGPEPVDEALFRGVQMLAGIAIAEHNRNKPDTPIRIETIHQGKVTVKVFSQDKLFGPGVRPAFALKDGFLLVASSPEAIARFGAHNALVLSKSETPLLRLSPIELSQLLKQRRAQVIARLQEKQHLTKEDAERNLDQLLGILDLFESVTFSQRSEPGQASWSLRAVPRGKH